MFKSYCLGRSACCHSVHPWNLLLSSHFPSEWGAGLRGALSTFHGRHGWGSLPRQQLEPRCAVLERRLISWKTAVQCSAPAALSRERNKPWCWRWFQLQKCFAMTRKVMWISCTSPGVVTPPPPCSAHFNAQQPFPWTNPSWLSYTYIPYTFSME